MDAIKHLTNALRCLPGVGPKSAQRMVYHLLQHSRQRGIELSESLAHAMSVVRRCAMCNTFTENEICTICVDERRDKEKLCVVDSPANINAIELSKAFNGRYFVLDGKISPLDGLGPEEIGLPRLADCVKKENVREVILALSPSVETEATMHFIQQIIQPFNVVMTMLAHGIPSGGEIEYLDELTILSALKNRACIDV